MGPFGKSVHDIPVFCFSHPVDREDSKISHDRCPNNIYWVFWNSHYSSAFLFGLNISCNILFQPNNTTVRLEQRGLPIIWWISKTFQPYSPLEKRFEWKKGFRWDNLRIFSRVENMSLESSGLYFDFRDLRFDFRTLSIYPSC